MGPVPFNVSKLKGAAVVPVVVEIVKALVTGEGVIRLSTPLAAIESNLTAAELHATKTFVVAAVEVATSSSVAPGVIVPMPTAFVGSIKIVEVPMRLFAEEKKAIFPAAPLKRDEVASAVGTAVAPVPFASTELAAIVARPIVAFEPPTKKPLPAERVRPLLPVSVVVATELSFAGVPLVVLQYESCPAVSFVDVAR